MIPELALHACDRGATGSVGDLACVWEPVWKEGDALCSLSRLVWFQGHGAEGRTLLRRCDHSARVAAAQPGIGKAYCDRADLDMESHENDSAIDFSQRAIALAETWANHLILSTAL